MCGIAGGFNLTENGKRYTSRIREAITCINHRGPDGHGVYQDDRVSLGHRRLSIIDTSTDANQPMLSADGNYVIIFNGEIFNFQELHEKYLAGVKLRTHSDTEIFLELFARQGTACFSLLRGFFAAAIFNRASGELYVVRDRFGKKPVHVFSNNDAVLFASELKALFGFGIPREINWSVLPYYLQLNYIPSPLSMVKNVVKLEPGHYMQIRGGAVSFHSYYELQRTPEIYGKFSYEQAKKKLYELMDEATRLRLIADVPLGAFLSGGIDSSVVVALASRHQQQLNTFSIGYKDHPFFDETRYAQLVANRYQTHHTVFSLTNNDFLEHIHNVLEFMDEPFADSSSIPMFILSQYTRKHVTVALSGDGGDEVFAGYNKHQAEWRMRQPSFAKSAVSALAPLWKLLPKSRNSRIGNKIRQLDRFAEGAKLSPEERYWRWASILDRKHATALLSAHTAAAIDAGDSFKPFYPPFNEDDFNEVLLADMKMVLPGDMLVKTDLMSMANSLEVRSPFLDQEVVSFAFGLPASFKIDGRMKKRIVQDTFRDILPAALYDRPKQGFDIPLLDWFRKELWGMINDDLLSDSLIREQNIFNAEEIATVKKKLLSSNPGDSHETIWALLVFQFWYRKYIL